MATEVGWLVLPSLTLFVVIPVPEARAGLLGGACYLRVIGGAGIRCGSGCSGSGAMTDIAFASVDAVQLAEHLIHDKPHHR